MTIMKIFGLVYLAFFIGLAWFNVYIARATTYTGPAFDVPSYVMAALCVCIGVWACIISWRDV